MSLTVTGTFGPNDDDNGLFLDVRVLTGAAPAASQSGAGYGTSPSGSDGGTAAITTTTAGAWVIGVHADSDSADSGAAGASGTTLLLNHAFTSASVDFASFASASAVGSPGSASYGITGASGNGSTAMAEILPSATIALDPSGPSPAGGDNETGDSFTTAPFTPVPGSLIVAVLSADANSGHSSASLAVTDSAGLAWRQLAYGNGASGMVTAVFAADAPDSAFGQLLPAGSAPSIAPGSIDLGLQFAITAGGSALAGYWWYVPGGGDITGSNYSFRLYTTTNGTSGTLVPGAAVTGSGTWTAALWNYTPLGSPVILPGGTTYVAAVSAAASDYEYLHNYWDTGAGAAGITSGPLSVPGSAAALGGNQQVFNSPGTGGFPVSGFDNSFYGLDVSVQAVSTIASGAASLAGSGTLTAAAAFGGTAALAGTGTLTAASTLGFPGTAALAGTGTLFASDAIPGTAALAGTGTLTAASNRGLPGATALAGTGTLTAAGHAGIPATAALAGTGTLAAAWQFRQPPRVTTILDEAGSDLLDEAGDDLFDEGAIPAARAYGGTVTPVNATAGSLSVTANALGGAVTPVNALSGTVTPVNALGGTLTSTDRFSGALAVETLPGGSLSVTANALGGPATEDTMQEVDITLNSYNDMTVTFSVTANGDALDLTTYTVNMYLKPQRGVADTASGVLKLSSAGGSPAISISNAPAGQCSALIAGTSITPAAFSFYRIDVVNSGSQTNTAIFGNVTTISL